jgi:haloacetate dehalogenase
MFFEGFTLDHIQLGDVTLRVRHGGEGPPVLLLHGHPRTHTTWHAVAPRLAEQHTIVCADLRGYGQSSKPPTTPDHAPYSKRALAKDCVELMRALGHDRFAVAGHDRGVLVALRTALDHPEHVDKLVVMDGLPVSEHLARCDARFAAAWWHWWFLGQTEKPAERVINADPDAWYRGDPEKMGAANHADYRAATRDPDTVHGMCEDYRAGLTIDREHEEADRAAGRRVRCPTLVLWSEHDDLEDMHGDPRVIWRDWADDVRGHSIPSGHHMAEEAPEELAASLKEFL